MSRTVLISGASKGIGRALAERMAEQGHKVVGIARTSDATPHPCGSPTGTRAGAHAGDDGRHGEAA
jgi:NAD(P)-dependent dehydrogenase (short-subunit alcohol dehydrogenase family)